MGQIKRMDQIRLIISTYLQTGSLKGTARRLNVSKNTVKNYLRRAQESGDDLKEILDRSDGELLSIFYPMGSKQNQDREHIFLGKIDVRPDLNLDGKVIYNGINKDIDVIKMSILNNPLNLAASPTVVIANQLPGQ